ncbi:MAG: hypothetical protein A2Y57_00155 [Candidatus Woykebacteria bacterium RBG_13_40_7b]|uniref:Uncharacterized protein n=1 Tax=Candidatus Woykebacteria bacterium RBG_13_40_7b TaxID=1802594 RepID=A0A1G1W6X4_9BACT|nr:MAG: hypothetical protein A2Y57_00155 [Candidatus Woykebacteria bacterium RBG_13_40_7b]
MIQERCDKFWRDPEFLGPFLPGQNKCKKVRRKEGGKEMRNDNQGISEVKIGLGHSIKGLERAERLFKLAVVEFIALDPIVADLPIGLFAKAVNEHNIRSMAEERGLSIEEVRNPPKGRPYAALVTYETWEYGLLRAKYESSAATFEMSASYGPEVSLHHVYFPPRRGQRTFRRFMRLCDSVTSGKGGGRRKKLLKQKCTAEAREALKKAIEQATCGAWTPSEEDLETMEMFVDIAAYDEREASITAPA